MSTIKQQDRTGFFSSNDWTFCIIAVWITVFYSAIIQYKYIEISNGMLILGVLVLATFLFSSIWKSYTLEQIFTNECMWMSGFMIYMLFVGLITSPAPGKHISQWVTSAEYMFLMIVIIAVIKDSGTDSFMLLLLIISIVTAVIFIKDPIQIVAGRYSISPKVNLNGLGMTFTMGIWVALYYQQKKKLFTPFSLAIGAVMIYCIFKTGSRKSLIAAGVIILLWYFFGYLPEIIKKKSKLNYIILALSVILLISLAIVFWKLYTQSDIAARMGGLDDEVADGKRSTMYKRGWGLLLSNPLFGLGFQGYSYYYGKYSHATLVEVPVSGGILGSILYYIIYYISIKKCIVLYGYCRKKEDLFVQTAEIKMMIIMWVVMLFYCTCIIHPYQFDSYIVFGLVFGKTAHIEKIISERNCIPENTQTAKKYIKTRNMTTRSKYIRI